MKILIVDDEPNIRDLMHRYLSLDGIESDCAENGLSAQRMLSEVAYDACLVDLKMPGMDGLSVDQLDPQRRSLRSADHHGQCARGDQ